MKINCQLQLVEFEGQLTACKQEVNWLRVHCNDNVCPKQTSAASNKVKNVPNSLERKLLSMVDHV